MKKSMIIALNAYLNNNDNTVDIAAIKSALADEVAKMNEVSDSKMKIYNDAQSVVFNVMTYDKPLTVKEIYTACEDDLPEDFSTSKLQYALLRYWSDKVKAFDNGKNPKTYVRI